jgi:hypothetical protein
MKTISGFVTAMGLCLALLIGDASARGFGGFRGGYGGFHGAYGGYDAGARERSFRAGEDYGARRPVYRGRGAGFYAGGWGIDESTDATYDDDGDDGDDD